MRAIRAETRDSILDAADRLLERHGYKKMRIDDIADEVGIGKGTVYLHFTSKEELALAHIDRIVARLLERLNEIADSADSPVSKIRQMLLARVLMRFDSVQHYSKSISDLLADIRTGLLARRERHFEEEAKIFARVLDEGLHSGRLQFTDAHITAQNLVLATNALLPYSLSIQELGNRNEIELKVASIADLLLNGLQSVPPAVSGVKSE